MGHDTGQAYALMMLRPAEVAASACRRLKDVHEKLGQDEEAGTKLGRLLSGIGSLLASEAAVGQVKD